MNIPKTISFSGKALYKMKTENTVSSEVLEALRKKADEICEMPTLKVTARKLHADSGNIHDYASIGTYWWPNPETENGLPYIKRDGMTNPDAIDSNSHETLCKNVFILALAAYYFEDIKYAKSANEALYDWFLNPETYMSPNAEYAQFIPGVCKGRGIGIIDFRFTYDIFDAVAILESLGMIENERIETLKSWHSDFLDWLITSENGNAEEMEPNNHGTWFDAIILSIAAFTNRPELFKKYATLSYQRRFLGQVKTDGSQPHELARTMALIYSISNIQGLITIVNVAESEGYHDFMKYEDAYGASILKKAIDFLYPYAMDIKSFPYQELRPEIVPERIARILLWLHNYYPEEGYAEKAKRFIKEPHLYLAKPQAYIYS